MDLYSKNENTSMTRLAKQLNVSKADDRIELLGNLDELTSHLGLIKVLDERETVKEDIERIQRNLITVIARVEDEFNQGFKIDDVEILHLEEKINELERSFPRQGKFILPGGTEKSARFDVARAVARRVERRMALVDRRFHVEGNSKKYLNRLSDYLYVQGRYVDHKALETLKEEPFKKEEVLVKKTPEELLRDEIIKEVTKQLGIIDKKIDLQLAKQLIEKVEEYAQSVGLNAVVAVCNEQGNPVALHVMDGAYLVSFSVALNKAYTSVAVQMSTQELSRLAQPGETFYGVDKADNGKIVIFGGGIPLKYNGKVIGGLGVSGGTAEQDAKIAEYGEQIFKELIEK